MFCGEVIDEQNPGVNMKDVMKRCRNEKVLKRIETRSVSITCKLHGCSRSVI